ncbi:hypothetical protein SLS58_005471 [Diplodia intermedia]|uniref:Uncharacterized protein n=1 Tax=Diplodia intermedia TaxID=856260 RepID=A0ABR3TQM3_9PEZI
MEQQAQHSTAANVDLSIPDSDPVGTNLLWSAIMSPGSSEFHAPPPDDVATTTTAHAKSKQTKCTTSTVKSASIDDVDFEAAVLKPRGVVILQKHTELRYEYAFQHFGNDKAPQTGKAAHYLKHHDPEIEVFIDGGPDFEKSVAKDYKTADSWRLVERRFLNLSIKYFLRQQTMDMDHEKTGVFLPERWDEENIQPDPVTDWNAFPILAEDENTRPFSFNISPGAMYWLSLQAFRVKFTFIAINYVHIHEERALTPYMSVEYKRESRDDEPAGYRKGLNQMACSSILSQYSRYKLRLRAMRMRPSPMWTDADSLAIRHYGLTICGADYDVWLAEAQVSKTGEWLGSRIRRLQYGHLKEEECTNSLVDWVNEIHHWGLGKYSEWVREDVQFLADKDGREL